MKCPKDGSQLARCLYEADIEVDECPKCHGIWLDEGELERIQRSTEKDYSEELKGIPNTVARAYAMARAKAEGEWGCPTCERTLARREYGYCSQIMIDVCPTCRGVWLDKGEIQALEVFFERARSEAKDIRRGFIGSILALFE